VKGCSQKVDKKGLQVIPTTRNPLNYLARLEGFEPPTYGLEVSTPEFPNLLNIA